MHWSMAGLIWLLAILAAVLSASALTFRSWRRFASRARGAVSFSLPQAAQETELDRLFDGLNAAHMGQNAVMGLFDNADAFAARVLSARQAGRSLDIMTYIWRADLTGWLLLRDLLEAADRGVRVRLLLDDVYVQGYDPVFLALSQHANIEVRLFNPVRSRDHRFRRALEVLLGLSRYNRRLHGKAWIADGRLAIIGGRNIGDTYFSTPEPAEHVLPQTGQTPMARLAPRRISRDADLMLSGPVVTEIGTLFDDYWNLGLVLPIRALLPRLRVGLRGFRRIAARRTASASATAFTARALDGRDAAQVLTRSLRWTGALRLLADPPDKAYGRRPSPWMADQVHALLARAQSEVRLITPYFVPGAAGLSELLALTRRGVKVSLLTNSLAASDNVIVHGAYRHYRGPLLAAGAEIFEFAPPPPPDRGRDVLHSKVFLIDGCQAIVGSLNFDMRSAHFNTELGVVVEDPALVSELLAIFDADSSPESAYELSVRDGIMSWSVCRPGLPPQMRMDPESSWARRALSWTVGHLPIHRWL